MDLQSQLQATLGDSLTIERELGGGGMARVFVALDRSLGRRVVIKTLSSDLGAISVERFRREIRVAASLQQANIVPVHAAGEVDGRPYYTMPFVEGQSLRARLEAHGALDVREAVSILRDVARALSFAHGRGVVHRDIKPGNILLSGNTAVVTDFGIAKAIEASHTDADRAALTHLGTALGTPAYISPEQVAGDPHVDQRADIYSLGVVAYELLAGAPPFTAPTAQAQMAAHVHEQPADLAERCPQAPRALSALVMRCLEKDPSRRPQNAAAILELLDADSREGLTPSHDGAARGRRDRHASLAVLPLVNLSHDPENEYFSDGVTEELINALGKVPGLRVTARTSAFAFKGASKDIRAIGRALNVATVLEGSVRRIGQRIRIALQLIDVATGQQEWSERYDRELKDIFAMQDDIAKIVADRLSDEFAGDHAPQTRSAANLEAYDAFLRGRFAFNKGTQQSCEHSIGHYERALTLDAAYAQAHVGLAEALAYSSILGADPRERFPLARRHVGRALGIDPQSVEGIGIDGFLTFWFDREWERAEALFLRALELDPNSVWSRNSYAVFLTNLGRPDEAVEHCRRTVELDPLWPTAHQTHGWALYNCGRYEESIVATERALELSPSYTLAIAVTGQANRELERYDAALDAFRRQGAASPTDPWHMAELVITYARMGRSSDARKALAKLVDRAGRAAAPSAALAWAHCAVGDLESAIACTERAVAELDVMVAVLPTYCGWDPLRGDARFERLLDDLKFPRWSRAVSDARLERRRARELQRGAAAATTAATPVVVPAPETLTSPVVTPATADRRSVAVLPFANLSPDPENAYFTEGVTDDLIAQVAKIGGLKVISRTSSMRFRDTKLPLRQIGHDLGASTVVEGTVRRAGNRVRVVAQLIDVNTDAHLWSETYDRTLDDVFAVQSDVALNIARALEASLTAGERRRLAARSTADPAAYDLYLLGRHHLNRRTEDSLKKAIDYFEQAIGRDARFAAAHAGLADAYVFAGIGYAPIPPVEAFAKAKAAAARALEIDDALPEAQCAMGLALMQGDWDVARSTQAFERAAAMNANHAGAFQLLAWCHAAAGDYARAAATQQRARELDPLNVALIAESGWPYSYAALPEIAIERYRRAVELDPGFALGHYNLALSYHSMGMYPEALASYERALTLAGQSPWMLTHYGVACIEMGNRAKGEEVLATLEQLSRAGIAAWLSIAMLLDAVGRTDEALDAVERAFAEHEPFVWALGLENWLKFPHARRHPRFRTLLDRIGVKPHDIPKQRDLLLALKQG